MGVLAPLIRTVGPKGQVTGLDNNPYCVQAARKFVKRNLLKNVDNLSGDIGDNTFQPQSFDLRHMRFVFTEKGCDSQQLGNMIELTKPGGVLISQESD